LQIATQGLVGNSGGGMNHGNRWTTFRSIPA
jgi:hypothetical protein